MPKIKAATEGLRPTRGGLELRIEEDQLHWRPEGAPHPARHPPAGAGLTVRASEHRHPSQIGITVGVDGPDAVLEWIDDYEHQATLAARSTTAS